MRGFDDPGDDFARFRDVVASELASGLAKFRILVREEVESGVAAALSEQKISRVPTRRASGNSNADSHKWAKRHMLSALTKEALQASEAPDEEKTERSQDQPKRHSFSAVAERIIAQNKSIASSRVSEDADLNSLDEPAKPLEAWVEEAVTTTNDSDSHVVPVEDKKRKTGLFMYRRFFSSKTIRLDATQALAMDVHSRLKRFMIGVQVETTVCLLIMLNTLSLGIQTDLDARYGPAGVPRFFDFSETCFCVVFAFEMALRLYTFRLGFFTKHDWLWNLFDFVVILSDIIIETMSWIGSAMGEGPNLGAVRVIRLVRLARVVRITRVVRHIPELRLLVISIINSIRSLLWTMLLLTLVIYTLSLYFTGLVAQCKDIESNDPDRFALMFWYYGSMPDTILTLFMTITGGVDWSDALYPLMEEVSPWIAVIFVLYVAVSMLCTLNVVTAVFVESVLKSQASDRDWMMVNNAKALFESLEGGVNTAMTWDIFESKLDASEMKDFFKAINVDPSEARCLFDLLDMDGSGEISAEEFLNGALRFRGPAKALDLALLFKEVQLLRDI